MEQEAPAVESAETPAGGGDPSQAVSAIGQALEQLASQLPEFQEVLDHYKSIAEGGGKPQSSGPVSMEAGMSGAKPMPAGG
jgi:hypothetical protein